MTREENDRKTRLLFNQRAEQAEPIFTRHAQVGDHSVKSLQNPWLQGCLRSVCSPDLVAGSSQNGSQRFPHIGFVIHNQHCGLDLHLNTT